MLSWLAKTDGAMGAFIKANRHPSGGNCFVLTTPSGAKLAGGNGSYGAETALKKGFEKWNKLATAERKTLPKGKTFRPAQVERCTPPPGGLVVASFVRNLKRDALGKYARITRDDLKDKKRYPRWNPVYAEPARYNLWLTESEWKSLVPPNGREGDSFDVPDEIQWRILRYHLVDGTYGLPSHWRPEHVRSKQMTLIVEDDGPVMRMSLHGSALMATDADLGEAHHGYDCRITGWIEHDSNKQKITRFDVVAVGECWGGDWEGGRFKRPGRAPLGVAFRLAGDTTADRVPPLVHMDRPQQYHAYFSATPKRK